MGEIFGAVGSIASAAITANAIQDATDKQLKALEKQRKFVYDELEPGKVNALANAADVDRAKNQLALQGIVDPALLRSRYASEAGLEKSLAGLGQGASEAVAAQASKEALGSTGDFDALKKRLIDTALSEIDAGASLPSDLQAELVKSGLERGGAAVGSVNPAGLAGNETRRLIGQEGLNLQAQRQGRAAALGQAAQSLEANRAQMLGSLFPALKQNQLATIEGQRGVFNVAAGATPEAGLSGKDIAQLWLARVGAVGQIGVSAADVAAKGAINTATALGTGLGAATSSIGKALPSTSQVYNGIFGKSSSGGGGGGGGYSTANMN